MNKAWFPSTQAEEEEAVQVVEVETVEEDAPEEETQILQPLHSDHHHSIQIPVISLHLYPTVTSSRFYNQIIQILYLVNATSQCI